VLGLLVVVGVMLIPFTVVIGTQFCLTLSTEVPEQVVGRDATKQVVLYRLIWRTLFGDRARWVCAAHDPGALAWKKRFIPVFVDCGTWWFPLVDMWISAAVGVVGGLTLSNTKICQGQLSVVSAAYLASLLLRMFVVKPLVLASKIYAVFLQFLGVVSCGAVAVALIQDQDQETPSVMVATYSMMMIALLSTVKSLADFIALSVAFPVAMKKAYSRVASLHTCDVPPAVQEPLQHTSPLFLYSDRSSSEVVPSPTSSEKLHIHECVPEDLRGGRLIEDLRGGRLIEGKEAEEEKAVQEFSILGACGDAGHLRAHIDYIREVELLPIRQNDDWLKSDQDVDFLKLVFSNGGRHAVPETNMTSATQGVLSSPTETIVVDIMPPA
jgi:hypothetical protein